MDSELAVRTISRTVLNTESLSFKVDELFGSISRDLAIVGDSSFVKIEPPLQRLFPGTTILAETGPSCTELHNIDGLHFYLLCEGSTSLRFFHLNLTDGQAISYRNFIADPGEKILSLSLDSGTLCIYALILRQTSGSGTLDTPILRVVKIDATYSDGVLAEYDAIFEFPRFTTPNYPSPPPTSELRINAVPHYRDDSSLRLVIIYARKIQSSTSKLLGGIDPIQILTLTDDSYLRNMTVETFFVNIPKQILSWTDNTIPPSLFRNPNSFKSAQIIYPSLQVGKDRVSLDHIARTPYGLLVVTLNNFLAYDGLLLTATSLETPSKPNARMKFEVRVLSTLTPRCQHHSGTSTGADESRDSFYFVKTATTLDSNNQYQSSRSGDWWLFMLTACSMSKTKLDKFGLPYPSLHKSTFLARIVSFRSVLTAHPFGAYAFVQAYDESSDPDSSESTNRQNGKWYVAVYKKSFDLPRIYFGGELADCCTYVFLKFRDPTAPLLFIGYKSYSGDETKTQLTFFQIRDEIISTNLSSLRCGGRRSQHVSALIAANSQATGTTTLHFSLHVYCYPTKVFARGIRIVENWMYIKDPALWIDPYDGSNVNSFEVELPVDYDSVQTSLPRLELNSDKCPGISLVSTESWSLSQNQPKFIANNNGEFSRVIPLKEGSKIFSHDSFILFENNNNTLFIYDCKSIPTSRERPFGCNFIFTYQMQTEANQILAFYAIKNNYNGEVYGKILLQNKNQDQVQLIETKGSSSIISKIGIFAAVNSAIIVRGNLTALYALMTSKEVLDSPVESMKYSYTISAIVLEIEPESSDTSLQLLIVEEVFMSSSGDYLMTIEKLPSMDPHTLVTVIVTLQGEVKQNEENTIVVRRYKIVLKEDEETGKTVELVKYVQNQYLSRSNYTLINTLTEHIVVYSKTLQKYMFFAVNEKYGEEYKGQLYLPSEYGQTTEDGQMVMAPEVVVAIDEGDYLFLVFKYNSNAEQNEGVKLHALVYDLRNNKVHPIKRTLFSINITLTSEEVPDTSRSIVSPNPQDQSTNLVFFLNDTIARVNFVLTDVRYKLHFHGKDSVPSKVFNSMYFNLRSGADSTNQSTAIHFYLHGSEYDDKVVAVPRTTEDSEQVKVTQTNYQFPIDYLLKVSSDVKAYSIDSRLGTIRQEVYTTYGKDSQMRLVGVPQNFRLTGNDRLRTATDKHLIVSGSANLYLFSFEEQTHTARLLFNHSVPSKDPKKILSSFIRHDNYDLTTNGEAGSVSFAMILWKSDFNRPTITVFAIDRSDPGRTCNSSLSNVCLGCEKIMFDGLEWVDGRFHLALFYRTIDARGVTWSTSRLHLIPEEKEGDLATLLLGGFTIEGPFDVHHHLYTSRPVESATYGILEPTTNSSVLYFFFQNSHLLSLLYTGPEGSLSTFHNFSRSCLLLSGDAVSCRILEQDLDVACMLQCDDTRIATFVIRVRADEIGKEDEESSKKVDLRVGPTYAIPRGYSVDRFSKGRSLDLAVVHHFDSERRIVPEVLMFDSSTARIVYSLPLSRSICTAMPGCLSQLTAFQMDTKHIFLLARQGLLASSLHVHSPATISFNPERVRSLRSLEEFSVGIEGFGEEQSINLDSMVSLGEPADAWTGVALGLLAVLSVACVCGLVVYKNYRGELEEVSRRELEVQSKMYLRQKTQRARDATVAWQVGGEKGGEREDEDEVVVGNPSIMVGEGNLTLLSIED